MVEAKGFRYGVDAGVSVAEGFALHVPQRHCEGDLSPVAIRTLYDKERIPRGAMVPRLPLAGSQ